MTSNYSDVVALGKGDLDARLLWYNRTAAQKGGWRADSCRGGVGEMIVVVSPMLESAVMHYDVE